MSTNSYVLKNKLHKRRHKMIWTGVSIGIATCLMMIIFVSMGQAELSPNEVSRILLHQFTGNLTSIQDISAYKVAIVMDIRLPRVLTAILVGCGLAVAGSVFQALLMNPLADPYTIGVSTGAAFGAVLAIYLNLFIVSIPLPVTGFAFVGAIGALMLVMRIATRKGVMSTTNLVLAGIIVSSILSAGISFLKSAAGEDVSAIVYWLMGSMVARSWNHVLIAAPFILLGSGLCFYFSQDLNAMSLGERQARALGVDVVKLRKYLLVCASLITAVCVSVSGIIGFVGLVIPHLIRHGLSADNRFLIPLSGLAGALLLLVADNISRLMFMVEVPVGVMMTLIGGPFFVYIFVKRNQGM